MRDPLSLRLSTTWKLLMYRSTEFVSYENKSFVLIWTIVNCSIITNWSCKDNVIRTKCYLTSSKSEFSGSKPVGRPISRITILAWRPSTDLIYKRTQSRELWIHRKSAKEVYNCIDRKCLPHINIESVGLFNIRWRFFWNGSKMLPQLAWC